MTAAPKALVERLRRFAELMQVEGHPPTQQPLHDEAADLITRLTAQLAEAEARADRNAAAVALEASARQQADAEVGRLREALAGLANRVKAEGSPYHTAILALDALVYDVKRRARQALAQQGGDDGQG